MKLQELFQKTSAYWVRYNEYEYKEKDGELFILPVPKANPTVYDPIKVADELVVDALNIGIFCMRQNPNEERIKASIIDFAVKYGLLGFMTALPTTPEFMDYEAVYLPLNPIIMAESMDTKEYVDMFFPFEKLDFCKKGRESRWDINNDRDMMALFMTFQDKPTAMNMSFQRNYAERYDWLRGKFKDWAYSLCASVFFYEEKDATVRDLHRQAMSAFGGIAPNYRISLYDDGPKIVWDFHSLLQTIQMIFSFALTDDQKPIRLCRYCNRAFVPQDARAAFCSPECKNKFNVYKSRSKNK